MGLRQSDSLSEPGPGVDRKFVYERAVKSAPMEKGTDFLIFSVAVPESVGFALIA
jgi:hypothetical protein